MAGTQPPPYSVKRVSMIAKGADVLVREYELEPGEFIPWHHHTQINDCFWGLQGAVLIETRDPANRHELKPGDTITVAASTPHHVSNASTETCRFLLVQGVGEYDFNSDV